MWRLAAASGRLAEAGGSGRAAYGVPSTAGLAAFKAAAALPLRHGPAFASVAGGLVVARRARIALMAVTFSAPVRQPARRKHVGRRRKPVASLVMLDKVVLMAGRGVAA